MVNLLFPNYNVITTDTFYNGVILVFENLKTVGYLYLSENCFCFNTSSANNDESFFETLSELLEFLKKEYPNCELKLFN